MNSATAPERLDTVTQAPADGRSAASPATVWRFWTEPQLLAEPLAPGTTSVEVTLTPDDDGTLLTLRHTAMSPTHAADHEKGWAYLLGERCVAAAAHPS